MRTTRAFVIAWTALLALGLATAGTAAAQDGSTDAEDDPFADDEPLFNDSEDPFADYEERATVDDGEDDGEDDAGNQEPEPDDEPAQTNDSPAWGLIATVGALGSVARLTRRR